MTNAAPWAEVLGPDRLDHGLCVGVVDPIGCLVLDGPDRLDALSKAS